MRYRYDCTRATRLILISNQTHSENWAACEVRIGNSKSTITTWTQQLPPRCGEKGNLVAATTTLHSNTSPRFGNKQCWIRKLLIAWALLSCSPMSYTIANARSFRMSLLDNSRSQSGSCPASSRSTLRSLCRTLHNASVVAAPSRWWPYEAARSRDVIPVAITAHITDKWSVSTKCFNQSSMRMWHVILFGRLTDK